MLKQLQRLFRSKSIDAERLAIEDAEREKIYAAYRGITRRLVKSGSAVAVDPNGHFGEVVRLTISPDPEAGLRIQRDNALCPICGDATHAKDRVAASLEPEFARGFSYLLGVWVHADCLERCEDTGEQRGIPW